MKNKSALRFCIVFSSITIGAFLSVSCVLQANAVAAVQDQSAGVTASTTQLAEQTSTTSAKTLLFLGNQNIAPVVFMEDNAPAGVVVDIARALVPYLSRPMEIRAMDWPTAQTLVAEGKADALMQINQTEERKKIYDFSDPLLESQFSIFTRTDRVDILGLASLHGVKVGVEKGGLPQQTLVVHPEIQLVVISDFLDGFKQLSDGTLDAVVVDYRVGSYTLAKNNIKDIRATGEPIAFSQSAFAVKKGNIKLLNEINAGLRTIKANGMYQAILTKWKPTEAVFQTQEQITREILYVAIGVLLVLFLIAIAWVVVSRRELAKRKAAEEAEKKAEQYAEKLVSSANAMVIGLDIEGKVTVFNESAESITGYKKAEVMGRNWFELVVPRDRYPETWRVFAEFQKQGKSIAGEFQNPILTKGGEERIIEWRNSDLRDDGKAIGTISYGIDITERKRVEDMFQARTRLLLFANVHSMDEVLEETLNEAEKLMGSLIGFYHFVDPDQNALTLQNWSTRTKKDFCKAEGKGSHYAIADAGVWADCVRERRPIIHNDYASLLNKKGMPPGHAKVVRELVVPVMRGDAVVAIMGIGNKAIDYDERDVKVAAFFADLAWNIVEPKIAEQAVQRAAAEIKDLYDHAPCGYHSLDKDGMFVRINETELAWLGYRQEEVLGKLNFADLITADSKKTFKEKFPHFKTAGFIRDLEFEMIRKDGSILPVLVSATAITDKDGNYLMSRSTVYDITERKRAEEVVKQLGQRDEMILNSAGEGIYGTDMEGNITFVNASAAKMLGYDAQEMIGKNSHHLFHHTRVDGSEYPIEACPLYKAIKEGKVYRGQEEGFWTKERMIFDVECVNAPLIDGGKVVGAVVVFGDVTKRKEMEDILRKSEEKYRTLIQKIQVAVVVHGADTRILSSNATAQELLGLTEDQMLGKAAIDPAWQFFHENGEVAKLDEYPVNLVLSSHKPLRSCTLRLHRSAKEHDVWVLVNADPVMNEKGEVVQVIVTFVDITERKRAEDLLREERRLFVGGPTVVFKWKNADGWPVEYVSSNIQSQFGYTPEEMTNEKFRYASLVHPDDIERIEKELSEHEKHNVDAFEQTYRIAHKDGRYRWVDDFTTVVKDGRGVIAHYYGYVFDITDRKEAENTLKESATRLNEAQRMAHIGNWVLDLQVNILTWSDEIYRMFEIDQKKFGATYEAFLNAIHPDDRKAVDEAYTNSLKTKKPYSIDHRLLFPDGRIKYVHEECETFYDATGKPLRSVGTVQDVTERKLAEEQLKELDKLKDDFLMVTTHELKSPLIPIKSQSQLLLAGDYGELNKEQKDAVEMIYRNGEAVNALANEVLDISKIKSKKLKIVPEHVAISDIVTEAVSDVKGVATQKKIMLMLAPIPNIPEIMVDRSRIKQVVLNLLDNAIKFTPENGIIDIKVKKTEDDIVVSVKDSGIGLNKDDIAKLFTPFFQVESDVSRKYRGTGLGLAISKGLIEAHGGTIRAESEGGGKGSTFIFTLPIAAKRNA
jgi:PAS domain S-box-containing protein